MSSFTKKIITSLVISIIILAVFIYGLGLLFTGTGGDIIIIALSIHFTIILCTLVIIEKLGEK